jgi:hypothetical protein
MINLDCKIGPVTLSLHSDSQLHPEVLETLLRQVTIHTSIAYSNMLEEGKKQGVLVVEDDD